MVSYSRVDAGPIPLVGAFAGPYTPDDLNAIRRLDWRFLLPDPLLQDGAYSARPGTSLATALERLCPSFVQLNTAKAHGRQFPLVVLGQPSLRTIREAAESVSPGGWLYAEFVRNLLSLRLSLAYPRRCCTELKRLKFDMDAFWHHPDFENCQQIIPLLEPGARTFALSPRPINWRKQMKFGLGRLLNGLELLPLMVPCFSVLAHKKTMP